MGPYSVTSYFTMNSPPSITTYYPATFYKRTDRSKLVVDWNYVFKSDSLITEFAIFFMSRNGD